MRSVKSVSVSHGSLLCARHAVLAQTSIKVVSSEKILRNARPSNAAAEVIEQLRIKLNRRSMALCDLCPQIGDDIAHLIGGHRAESVPVEMDDTAVPLRLSQTLVRAPHEPAAGI